MTRPFCLSGFDAIGAVTVDSAAVGDAAKRDRSLGANVVPYTAILAK